MTTSFKTASKIILVGIFMAFTSFAFAQSEKLLFPKTPGVVSYTYRKFFEKDVPGTLDMVKAAGFTDIEFSNLFLII